MLAKMWRRKGDHGTVWVRMQTGTATVENSMDVSQKTFRGTTK